MPREARFYDNRKNVRIEGARDGAALLRRDRDFARLDWLAPERASLWADIARKQDPERARAFILAQEQSGDLDHGEWLRAQVTSWGAAPPPPLTADHGDWLKRRGHYVPDTPEGFDASVPVVDPWGPQGLVDRVERAVRRRDRDVPAISATPDRPRPPELHPGSPQPPQPHGDFGLGTVIPASATPPPAPTYSPGYGWRTSDDHRIQGAGQMNAPAPELQNVDQSAILATVPAHGEFGGRGRRNWGGIPVPPTPWARKGVR
jgi:hypothetical protein